MLPFPTTFPADAAQIIIDHKAGVSNVTCEQAELACWNLCGYASGKAQEVRNQTEQTEQPDQSAKTKTSTSKSSKSSSTAQPSTCDEDQLVEHLKTACNASRSQAQSVQPGQDSPGKTKAIPDLSLLPWLEILDALVSLYQRLRNR